jgi:hypothetical protein
MGMLHVNILVTSLERGNDKGTLKEQHGNVM